MKKIIIPIIAALAFNANAAKLSEITLSQITESIHALGAKKFIKIATIVDPATNISEWDLIMNGISMGDPEWLSLAPLLAPATDAGSTDDLITALTHAIPKNADGVMHILDDNVISLSTQNICSMILWKETVAEQNEYFVKAVQALYKNNTVQAQKCLTQLVTIVGQAGPFKRVD